MKKSNVTPEAALIHAHLDMECSLHSTKFSKRSYFLQGNGPKAVVRTLEDEAGGPGKVIAIRSYR